MGSMDLAVGGAGGGAPRGLHAVLSSAMPSGVSLEDGPR